VNCNSINPGGRVMLVSRFIQWILRIRSAKSSEASSTPAFESQPARKVEPTAGAFEDIKDLQRYPLSCERLKDGLLFHFSNGTNKFIPDSTPPLSEPEADENASREPTT